MQGLWGLDGKLVLLLVRWALELDSCRSRAGVL